jgi:hypothetical protein
MHYYQNMQTGHIIGLKENDPVRYIAGIKYESLAMPRANQTAINTYKVIEGLK